MAVTKRSLTHLAALWYVKRLGLYIFPCHEPIFDEAGKCIGCTCEAHKRSDNYRRWLASQGREKQFDPNFVCPNPGKHPRISGWKDKGSNDPDQIEKWWSRWPTANIGWCPGRDGYAVLDGDSYKATYAGDGALTAEEQETPKSLTGNGGTHLVFAKHPGAVYSNSPGDLPAGIDVRADNGLVILAPSMHPSGNRYRWQDGYWPHQREAQQLPDRIHNILIEAARKNGARAVDLGEPSGDPPNLAAWDISERTLLAIHQPAEKGQRSETDMSVVVALCYAGVSDDEILSVFHHFPIGRKGKFAERGRDYLARTIARARQFVAENPRNSSGAPPEDENAPGVPLQTMISEGMAWLPTARCAQALRSAGFKRIEGPRKTLGALLDIAKRQGLRFVPGLRQIAELAGCSAPTVGNHLNQLRDAGLVEITPTDFGLEVYLKFVVSYFYTTSPPSVNRCKDNSRRTFWHDHKADDAFQSCAYKAAIRRRRYPTVLMDSLSAAAALVWHALEEHGQLTRAEIAEETGMKPSSVASATRKLERAGLLLVWQEGGARSPKVYELHPIAEELLDERRAEMKSYGTALRRRIRHTTAQAERLNWQLATERDPWARARMKRRAQHVAEMDAKWRSLADDLGIAAPRGRRWRMGIKVDKAEAWNNQYRQVWEQWQALDDLPEADRFRYLDLAGYAHEEIEEAVRWGPKFTGEGRRFIIREWSEDTAAQAVLA